MMMTWHTIATVHMAVELHAAQHTRAQTVAGILRARRAGLAAGLMAAGYAAGGTTAPDGVPQFWCPSCHAAALAQSGPDGKSLDTLAFSVVNLVGLNQ